MPATLKKHDPKYWETFNRYYTKSFNDCTIMEARKWTLKSHFEGMPKLSDFEMTSEPVNPILKDGEIITRAEWLTVDPYMRAAIPAFLKPGDVLMGQQVARVIKSRHPDFPEGTKVVGSFGWRDITVYKPGTKEEQRPDTIHVLPDLRGLPESYALGVCGMPGVTALYGLTKICQAKAGETLVVSAAAGAVGSLVGQIGKNLGCHVIGFAGSEEKVRWLKELGFDQAFNYKTNELPDVYKEHATKGIDCYFDNVGGYFTYHTIQSMNPKGRVALCGCMQVMNENPTHALVPLDYASIIYKSIRIEGFINAQFGDIWFEGISQLRDMILEGKLKTKETMSVGFDSMPQAFIDMLAGKNTGKQIILNKLNN